MNEQASFKHVSRWQQHHVPENGKSVAKVVAMYDLLDLFMMKLNLKYALQYSIEIITEQFAFSRDFFWIKFRKIEQ